MIYDYDYGSNAVPWLKNTALWLTEICCRVYSVDPSNRHSLCHIESRSRAINMHLLQRLWVFLLMKTNSWIHKTLRKHGRWRLTDVRLFKLRGSTNLLTENISWFSIYSNLLRILVHEYIIYYICLGILFLGQHNMWSKSCVYDSVTLWHICLSRDRLNIIIYMLVIYMHDPRCLETKCIQVLMA